MKRPGAIVLCAAVVAALGTAAASAAQPDVEAARQATAKFHNLAVTQANGYGQFADAAGILCIDNLGVGGMGIHYVNGGNVGNPSEDIRHPEALVYAPDDFGRLKLAAAEYIVDKATWDADAHGAAAAVRPGLPDRPGRQPLRTRRVLRATRVAVEAQSQRVLQRLEPARLLLTRPRQRIDPGQVRRHLPEARGLLGVDCVGHHATAAGLDALHDVGDVAVRAVDAALALELR